MASGFYLVQYCSILVQPSLVLLSGVLGEDEQGAHIRPMFKDFSKSSA